MQALWMVLGAFFFASMGVCVKIASEFFNSFELVFWRGVFSTLLVWLLARHQGVALTTRYPGMHLWRSVVGVVSLGAWFYAIAGLPLATAMTLNYTSSLWIGAFLVGGSLVAWNPRVGNAALALQAPLALAVLAGFAGVVLTLRPTMAQEQAFAGVVGLLSGLVSAFAYLQVMALGKVGEHETRTVFLFSVGIAVFGALAAAIAGWSPWPGWHALWLLPMALFAALGQLCLTRAYSHGATLVVACLQYFGIVFSAVFSLALFGDHIDLAGWAGMALIVASGVGATVLRARAVAQSPAEEH